MTMLSSRFGALLSTAGLRAPVAGVRPTGSQGEWHAGRRGDFFPGLTWASRPSDLERSGAPLALHDVWVATLMAVQEAHGRLATGTCYFVNMAGAPLVQKVLGEPVHVCAGFARYVDRHDIIQTGFRWRPAKWERWIDATVGASCEPLGDVHCWLETTSHFIDFDGGTGDPNDVWPPLIYRPKATLAKHPRDTDSTGAILVWRNSEARDFVGSQLAPLVLPIASRAVEIFDVFVNGSQVERQEETMGHEFVMSLARRALTTCSEVAWAQAWAQCMGLAAGEAPQSLSGPPENKQAAIEIIEPRRLQKGTPHAA